MKKDEKIFWIVGKYNNDSSFEICGLYDDKQKALKRCFSSLHGLGPMTLNEDLSEKTEWWPGFYYPSAKRREFLKLRK